MRKEVYAALLAAALSLLLLTTYMAIYYAPLPTTSVQSLDEAGVGLEGMRVSVTGFAFDVNEGNGTFMLGDHVDYFRWLSGSREGWMAAPIPIKVTAFFHLMEGQNLTLSGTVTSASGLGVSTEPFDIDVNSPNPQIMVAPVSQKIFYFHMPAAWVCYLAFFVTLVASILYLRSRNVLYDMVASSSAVLGLLFASIALLTGPIWAKQEWGVYWDWSDAKLVATLVLWLAYVGYLMVRRMVRDDRERMRVSAVYGIVAFLTVPLSFLASRIAVLSNSVHPIVVGTGQLSAQAALTVGIGVLAFTLLFVALLLHRVEIGGIEMEMAALKMRRDSR
jgi:heme exporter protein C